MHTVLYYDCFCGISGDMHLGAMLDLGIDPQQLKDELQKLPLNEYSLEVAKVEKNGIGATSVTVVTETSPSDGHPAPQHPHEQSAGHGHATRGLQDINELIDSSGLSDSVKQLSKRIFLNLARAEAKVHNTEVENIHFHEVGAVDSIIDIVGSAVCLDILDPSFIVCSPVQLGGGFVRSQHGLLPVPAPATAELLKQIPVRTGLVQQETTTPTGAAILATVVDEFSETVAFAPDGIGYGAGKRDLRVPNLLRVFTGKQEHSASEQYETARELIVETNIDDMNPEDYEPLMEKLSAAGAKDVFLTPITMKKTRPATMVRVLTNRQYLDEIMTVLFADSSTFGLRVYPVDKYMLRREFRTVSTRYGDIGVKLGIREGKTIKKKLEYEDCRNAAEAHNVPLREVREAAEQQCRSLGFPQEKR